MVKQFRKTIGSIASLVVVCFVPAASAAQQYGSECTPAASPVQLPGLAEASGLAVSSRAPGRLWTHNDSGKPMIVAVDSRGTITGQVHVTGASVEDWEAIAVGPCDGGSCVYIGDIGDNEAGRKRITVYRIPEPDAASGTAAVSAVFHGTYPDGAHDAETLLAAGGRLYVVTKGETGPLAIYRFPAQLQAGATMRLERVGAPASKPDADSRITDGSVSPDGQWVVLRSRSALTFYRAADVLSGQWRAASTVNLSSLKEPQGEGVALAADNTVFLAGEGGGRGEGTFARLSCGSPRG